MCEGREGRRDIRGRDGFDATSVLVRITTTATATATAIRPLQFRRPIAISIVQAQGREVSSHTEIVPPVDIGMASIADPDGFFVFGSTEGEEDAIGAGGIGKDVAAEPAVMAALGEGEDGFGDGAGGAEVVGDFDNGEFERGHGLRVGLGCGVVFGAHVVDGGREGPGCLEGVFVSMCMFGTAAAAGWIGSPGCRGGRSRSVHAGIHGTATVVTGVTVVVGGGGTVAIRRRRRRNEAKPRRSSSRLHRRTRNAAAAHGPIAGISRRSMIRSSSSSLSWMLPGSLLIRMIDVEILSRSFVQHPFPSWR